jgi:hypothetical protein
MFRDTIGAMLVALACCLIGACSAPKHYVAVPRSGEVASPKDDQCDSILAKERTWKTIAAMTAVAGGAGGLSTIPLDDKDARAAVAIGAIGVGVLSAGSVYLSESYASEFRDKRCAEP